MNNMKRQLNDKDGQKRAVLFQCSATLNNANCSLMYTYYFGLHLKLFSHAEILRGESGRGRKKPKFLKFTENMPQTTPWKHKYPFDPFPSPGKVFWIRTCSPI